jgi:predicted MFS family arabinose efflux permease
LLQPSKSARRLWTTQKPAVSDTMPAKGASESPAVTSRFPALANPTLRLIAVALLLLGALNASVYPYQSLIGIERIGLSKPAFSLVLVLASAVAVTSSVLFGILGDMRGNRRLIALSAAACGASGLAMMLAYPAPLTFILSHGILLPVASSLYGQLFALARLASPADGRARDGILGTIRAAMSVSFLFMLVFWTFAFGAGAGVMTIYISAGLASFAMLGLLYVSWPRQGATDWHDAPSGLNLRDAFAEIARPHVLVRLLLLGGVSSSGILYMVLVSLVFDASPVRDASDVALYVGLVAGWEVPCLLLMPRLVARVRRTTLIALGSALYTCHLIALPILSDSPLIWAMTLIAGIGGTAIISLPIPYYQDLLHGRPGTAGAMLALQKLVADVMGAAAFAVGTSLGGYETVAIIGTLLALTGAGGLYLVDRNHWLMPATE